MTKLRRCSPEIERELHDKEARIRELEAALERLIDAAHPHMAAQDHAPDPRCGLTQPITVAEGEELNNAVANARTTITRLHAPPDSEPAEAATLSHMEEQLGWRAPQHHDTAQRQDAGDALRAKLSDPETMQRVTERAAEQQDAMLERRDALEALDEIEEAIVSTANILQDFIGEKTTGILGSQTVDPLMVAHGQLGDLRQALSRTSDEGTGCVVPEAVRRLPEDWRRWASAVEATRVHPGSTFTPGCVRNCADQLDRAIAEQGGQRVPEAVLALPKKMAQAADYERQQGDYVSQAVWQEAMHLTCRATEEAEAAAPQHEQEEHDD